MARSILTFCLLFFITVQSIPGSMQAFADHVIEPSLIEVGLYEADNLIGVKCCDDNNLQDAKMCKADCRLVQLSAIDVPQAVKKSFVIFQITDPTKSHSPPNFRPPIA